MKGGGGGGGDGGGETDLTNLWMLETWFLSSEGLRVGSNYNEVQGKKMKLRKSAGILCDGAGTDCCGGRKLAARSGRERMSEARGARCGGDVTVGLNRCCWHQCPIDWRDRHTALSPTKTVESMGRCPSLSIWRPPRPKRERLGCRCCPDWQGGPTAASCISRRQFWATRKPQAENMVQRKTETEMCKSWSGRRPGKRLPGGSWERELRNRARKERHSN